MASRGYPQRHLRGRHHDVRDARRRAAVQRRSADADRLPARQRGRYPRPASKNPRVPGDLDEIVQWATARDPEEPTQGRPGRCLTSCAEIHDALRPSFRDDQQCRRTVVLPQPPRLRRAAESIDAPASRRPPKTPRSSAGRAVVRSASAVGWRPPGSSADRNGRSEVWRFIAPSPSSSRSIAGGGGRAGSGSCFGPGLVGRGYRMLGGPLQRRTATALLQEQGFTVNATPTARTGLPTMRGRAAVAADRPADRPGVSKGQVIPSSSSPRDRSPITVPPFAGMTEDEASVAAHQRGAVQARRARALPVQHRRPPEGIVVDVLGADKTTSILAAGTYGEDQEVTLIISAGLLPGMSSPAGRSMMRKQILAGVGLEVDSDVREGVPQRHPGRERHRHRRGYPPPPPSEPCSRGRP